MPCRKQPTCSGARCAVKVEEQPPEPHLLAIAIDGDERNPTLVQSAQMLMPARSRGREHQQTVYLPPEQNLNPLLLVRYLEICGGMHKAVSIPLGYLLGPYQCLLEPEVREHHEAQRARARLR